jgi:hypothetical protein
MEIKTNITLVHLTLPPFPLALVQTPRIAEIVGSILKQWAPYWACLGHAWCWSPPPRELDEWWYVWVRYSAGSLRGFKQT